MAAQDTGADKLRFDGRVALVTGAGNGLGRSYALELARRGAKVVVNDIGTGIDGVGSGGAAADAVVAEIRQMGGEALASVESVSTPEGGGAAVRTALEGFGRIDILVANAGILRDRSFGRMSVEAFDAVLAVHLRGTFNVAQPAFAFMREHGGGHMVLTTSAGALFGNVGQANYAAAKMGIVGLTRTLALEGARARVTVNCVAPSASTRMTQSVGLAPAADADDPLAPERVAALVVALSHPSCPCSGGIYAAVGKHYGRVVVAVNEKLAIDASAESIASQWERLNDLSSLTTPADAAEFWERYKP